MSALTFDKNELGNLEYSLQREVLSTDRRGGYMSTTIVCCNTRRYHGLMVAPIGRGDQTCVLLSSLDETIVQHDQSFNLAIHRFRGVYEPRGHKYITDFAYTPTPTITYRVGGVILRKELLWIHKRTQLMIRYTLLDSPADIRLRLRPFFAYREKEALTHANMEANGRSYPVQGGVKNRLYEGYPWLYLQTNRPDAEFVAAPDWYYGFEYPQELARGYDGYEDLLTTGYFELPLSKGQSVIFSASVEEMASSAEIGARMYASRGSMDLSVKDGGLPPDSVVQTVDEIMADSARVIEKYHDKSFGAMHRVALAPCSPFSVSADLLRESAVLAREYGVRLHTHLCETKDEEHFMLAREGVRPLEYMERLGWTGSDVWFAHGIHFNDEELRVLAKTHTGVAHCPISNMKLASGVARVPEMLKLGVPVGLAVDGSASNDGSSLMEELRVAFLLHRLNSSKAAPSGYDVLKMATCGSAAILGRSDDIGSLEVGKCCDLFMIDSRRLELVGSCFDPKSVLGTVGVRGPVDYTVVQGRVTVDHGHLVTVDEEQLAHDAEAKCRAYLNR